jgi:hypothetical protein
LYAIVHDKLYKLSTFFLRLCPVIVAYLLNRVPSKFVDRIPYKIWNGKRPNISYLKILGI